MKTISMILIILSIGVLSSFAQTTSPPNAPDDSDSIKISAQDLKVFRQAVADKIFFEKQAKVWEKSYDGCQETSAQWKRLYQAEQSRADNVQGERITKLESIIKEKDLRITNYITQANQFRDENLTLTADNKRLRKQRWKIGAISFGIGAGVGGIISNRVF